MESDGSLDIPALAKSILRAHSPVLVFSKDTLYGNNFLSSRSRDSVRVTATTGDSVTIDSIQMILDTVRFPKYEIMCWIVDSHFFDPVAYGKSRLHQIFLSDEYGYNDPQCLKWKISSAGTDLLYDLEIADRLDQPLFAKKKASNVDTITAKMVLYTEGHPHPIWIKGIYNTYASIRPIASPVKPILAGPNTLALYNPLGQHIRAFNHFDIGKRRSTSTGIYFDKTNRKHIIKTR